MTVSSVNRAPRPSSLADVLDVVLDKGIVIDAYIRVAVVGIELLTVDARIVIASVDTYLRFAEAVNRLDLQPSEQVAGLPGMVHELREGGANAKTRGALGGAKDTAKEFISNLTGGDDDEDGSDDDSGDGSGQENRRSRQREDRGAPASRRARQRG